MSTVQLENVSKSFGATIAAENVSFEVRPGELLTLLGPSGCGKTTLLRIVAGFLRPSSGLVRLAGKVVNTVPPHLRHVGLVFQSYALFPHMTVRDNVAFGLKMHGVSRAESERRVAEILDLVQLSERAGHVPSQLSGGQQQRVALARALVTQPTILLLDEPFSALDRQIGELLRAELKRIQRRLSISTILVTHAQDEALMLADRVVVMNQGRIEQIGAPEELYRWPRTRFVAEFLGRSNLVRIGDVASRIRIAGPVGTEPETATTELHGPQSALRIAMVRPEYVRLHCVGGATHDHWYAGRVEEAHYLGHTRLFRIRLDVGVSIEALTLSADGRDLVVDSVVFVEIPPEAFHVVGNSGAGELPRSDIAATDRLMV
jgi:ABC-type Fe3+/spermidine/putrescine transport system ATPase subunit